MANSVSTLPAEYRRGFADEDEVWDLSHAITDQQPCTFTVADKCPQVSFEEGEAHGMFFVTSHVDNLSLNTCTHIDFPGHLPHIAERASHEPQLVGSYPVERFIGPTLVLNVSDKLAQIQEYFTDEGHLEIDPRDGTKMLEFLRGLDELKIDLAELVERVDRCGCDLESLTGLLFASGANLYWKYEAFESWQYLYFYNPCLTREACEAIVAAKLSFVGIDAFQLEHPLINFRGDELPVILNPDCREFVRERLAVVSEFANHTMLLGNDVLIYENLRLPRNVRGVRGHFSGVPLNFQLPGVTDNALARPYFVVKSEAGERPTTT